MQAKHAIILATILVLVAVIIEPYLMAPSGTTYSLSMYVLSTSFKTLYKLSAKLKCVRRLRDWREKISVRSLLVTFNDTDVLVTNFTLKYDSSSPLYYSPELVVHDSVQVPARVIVPANVSEKLPLFVFFHGGGWQLNSIDSYHPFLKDISRAGFVVVTVNYRKSPEYTFPQPFNDCLQTLIWAYENGEKHGADVSKLIISGDSAGGAMASAIGLYLRDHTQYKSLKISFQVLLYPAVYYPCHNPSRFETYKQYYRYGYIIDGEMVFRMWRDFAGKYHNRTHELPYLVPLNAKSFKDLPPTFIIVAEHDPLRGEGEEFTKLLQEAGVATKTKFYPRSFHGFACHMARKDVIDDITNAVKIFLQTEESKT